MPDEPIDVLLADVLALIEERLGIKIAVPNAEPAGWKHIERILESQPWANRQTLKKFMIAAAMLACSGQKPEVGDKEDRASLPSRSKAEIDHKINEVMGLIEKSFGIAIKTKSESAEWQLLRRILAWEPWADKKKSDMFLIATVILAAGNHLDQITGDWLSLLLYDKEKQHYSAIAMLSAHVRELLDDFYHLEGCTEGQVIEFKTRSLIPKFKTSERNLEFGKDVAQAWIRRQEAKIQQSIDLKGHDIFTAREEGHEGACLLICSVVRVHDPDGGGEKNILLIPKRSESDREGLGRTAILLSLAGLVVPYWRLMDCSIDSLPAAICPRVSKRSPEKRPLLVADRAYLLISSESVEVIPIRGEPIDFMWDFTRHLYRSTQVDYMPGNLNNAKTRPDLLKLFSRMRFDSEVFGKYSPLWRTRQVINEIVLVELRSGNCDDVKQTVLSPHAWIFNVCEGLKFSAEHQAPFWRDRNAESLAFIETVQGLGKLDKAPNVTTNVPLRQLTIQHKRDVFSQEMFSDAAELLASGRDRLGPPGTRGVSAHNNAVIGALQSGDCVTVLATSGAKLVGDRDFWKVLKGGIGTLSLLLLDPEWQEGISYRNNAYRDLGDHFLRKEIRDSIETVLRLREDLHLDKRLNIGIYQEIPQCKLVYFNEERFLVASYLPESRTDSRTVFQEIRLQDPLFWVFKTHLTCVEALTRWL